MRVWLTGGTGFVGSNIVYQALERAADVMTTVHRHQPSGRLPYSTDLVDLTDGEAVAASVAAFAPDVVVHSAILNDWALMAQDQQLAWDAYVTATQTTIDAAVAAGAAYVLVSTDWVFDGTQGGADEATAPNPINQYGMLKLVSEIVALERGGAVGRVSGVNGVHRARPAAPRAQDPGFGYFVASIVDALTAGRRFTVWQSDDINMRATPSLASETADMILDIGARRLDGVFHCCGGEPAGRMELAFLACEVFELDSSLLETGPPDPAAMPAGLVPYDTSITLPRTARLLERRPTPLRELLERFREQYEAAGLGRVDTGPPQ
jgi:dTDP-4-dehydrorhamnose reductase